MFIISISTCIQILAWLSFLKLYSHRFLYFCKAEAIGGIIAGLESANSKITISNFYHEKKYHNSLTLNKSFLPYKLSL